MNKLYESKNKELKSANLKLQKSEKNLRELSLTKGKFIDIIAHDLKNPFGALFALSDILYNYYDRLTSDKVKENIHLLHTASKRIFDLLENLLEWSRAQSGRIEFNPGRINLHDACEDSIALFETNAGEKNITVSLQVSKSYV